jgi:hypothetical protein
VETTPLETNRWIHLTGVYEPGVALRLYVDGVLAGERTDNVPASQYNNGLDVWIGQRPDGCCPFDGLIDEVRLYDRVLSAGEAEMLYNGASTDYPVVTTSEITVDYLVDGVAEQKTFTGLANGQQELTIEETDSAGNLSTFSFTVLVDLPVVIVNPPTIDASAGVTKETTHLLTGTKPAGTSIWINGAEAVPADTSMVWSYEINLIQEGDNPFNVTAKDSADNESEAVSITVERDTAPPVIALDLNSPYLPQVAELPTDQQIGHWDFEGAVGGTVSGAVTSSSVYPNSDASNTTSMSFDGVDDHVNLGNGPEFQITGALTASAWVYIDDFDSSGRIISKQGGWSSSNGWQRGWSLHTESNGVAGFQIAPAADTLIGVETTPLETNRWIHLTGVYEPGVALRIYVDGELRRLDWAAAGWMLSV